MIFSLIFQDETILDLNVCRRSSTNFHKIILLLLAITVLSEDCLVL